MNEAQLLERAKHERMRDMLADPLAAEIARNWATPDRRAVALLVYLEKRKRRLLEEQYRLIEEWNPSSGEMVIVVPPHELPLPDSLDSITYYGMHVRRGPEGDPLPCRVALEGARYPSNMTPTWVR